MQINTSIVLEDGDSFIDADEAAAQVLAAVGGDPTKDYVVVNVQQHANGSAGIPLAEREASGGEVEVS